MMPVCRWFLRLSLLRLQLPDYLARYQAQQMLERLVLSG
jgi:hypothetical protein